MDYIRTNVGIVVERLKSLTAFETDLSSTTGPSSRQSCNVQEQENESLNQSKDSILHEMNEEEEVHYSEGDEQKSVCDHQQYDSESLISPSHPTESIESSEQGNQKLALDPEQNQQDQNLVKTHRFKMTKYEQRVTRNFERLLEEITVNKSNITEEERTVATQTKPLQFAPPVSAKFLLGEVRPWGKPSEFLPRKGVGMYKSRTKKASTSPTLPTIQ